MNARARTDKNFAAIRNVSMIILMLRNGILLKKVSVSKQAFVPASIIYTSAKMGSQLLLENGIKTNPENGLNPKSRHPSLTPSPSPSPTLSPTHCPTNLFLLSLKQRKATSSACRFFVNILMKVMNMLLQP